MQTDTTTAGHFTVSTYLGVRHYDNRGRVFTTEALAAEFARRCEGGSGRSGGGTSAAITPCDCPEWAGKA